jgi:alkylhydroperoxidase family enzyme
VQTILKDYRNAPIGRKLQETLSFLEKITLSAREVGSEDAAALRMVGLTDQALVDAIYICAGFNIIDRIADAFGFKVPPAREFVRAAKFLSMFGYKILSGVWFGSPDPQLASRVKEGQHPVANEATSDPYDNKMKQLKEAVLSGPGTLDVTVRKAASVADDLPGELGSYIKKVAQNAYKVTDEDIARLREASYSEDQIFEVTVSTALGAGLMRLESGLNALRITASGV